MTRFARLQERLNLISCLVAVTIGCSSSKDSGLMIPDNTSGGSNGVSGSTGNSSSGGSTGSGNATGSGGGGITLPPMNGGGSGGIEGCVETSSTAMPLPPNLEFLIDTSLSMSQAPMGSAMGAATKWVSTRDALKQAFTDMADGTGTGLIFYPNVQAGGFPTGPGGPGMGRGGAGGLGRGGGPGFPGAGGPGVGSGGTTGTGSGGATGNSTCIMRQVAVAQAALNTTQRNAILMALSTKQPNGNTPTHDAYNFAVETIKASTLPGPKYVVLVTDGAPTFSLGCVGDGTTEVDASPIVQAVADAAKAGIKTFVIGSPGSETARESLSKMATQGGTPLSGCSDAGPNYCHFDMTTATDLSSALNAAFKAITGQVVSTCTYNIPPPSGGKELDLRLVDVSFTNGMGQTMRVSKDSSDDMCNRGWNFSADKKQIVLCPDMCDAIKSDNGAKVNVVFACTPIAR